MSLESEEEELAKKIATTTRRNEDLNGTVFTAHIVLSAQTIITDEELQDAWSAAYLERIVTEDLRKQILGMLRTKELAEELAQLYRLALEALKCPHLENHRKLESWRAGN